MLYSTNEIIPSIQQSFTQQMVLFTLEYLKSKGDNDDPLTKLEKKFITDTCQYHDCKECPYNKLTCAITDVYYNRCLKYVYKANKHGIVKYYNDWTGNHPNETNDNLDCATDPSYDSKHIYYAIDIDEKMKQEVMFPEDHKVILINPCGINDDPRGIDQTEIELDFHSKWVLKDNTYESFVEGLYRTKSCKFDTTYEMFIGINNIKINSNTKTIKIYLWFNHGS